MKVLITGGAGFVGSTIASCAVDHGWTPVILDDLSTGRREFTAGRIFYEGDIASSDLVARVFCEHPDIFAVVHCAAKIVVSESVQDPLAYYMANVSKTISLLSSLQAAKCTRLLFSSTAALYESPADYVVTELSASDLSSPYAASKWMVERILADACRAKLINVLSLRYFNPIGADPELRTGLQLAQPTHALGMLIRALESDHRFTITGTDWNTPDGSGIRDYIHVWDLAEAHITALEKFDSLFTGITDYEVVNLGTGTGVSVRELVAAFERVSGIDLIVASGPPRPGDVAGAFTSATKARDILGWSAIRTLDDGIRDSIEWRRKWTQMSGGD